MTTNHDHLREVAERATPGPWHVKTYGGGQYVKHWYISGPSFHVDTSDAHVVADLEFAATFNPTTAIALLDELAALRKENEGLRVDAERYRWIRNDQTGGAESSILIDRYGDVEVKLGDSLDQAIDAARAAIGDSHE